MGRSSHRAGSRSGAEIHVDGPQPGSTRTSPRRRRRIRARRTHTLMVLRHARPPRGLGAGNDPDVMFHVEHPASTASAAASTRREQPEIDSPQGDCAGAGALDPHRSDRITRHVKQSHHRRPRHQSAATSFHVKHRFDAGSEPASGGVARLACGSAGICAGCDERPAVEQGVRRGQGRVTDRPARERRVWSRCRARRRAPRPPPAPSGACGSPSAQRRSPRRRAHPS